MHAIHIRVRGQAVSRLAMTATLFVASCVTVPGVPIQQEVPIRIDYPEIGVLTTAELGDTLVSKGEQTELTALRLHEPVKSGDPIWIGLVEIPRQDLRALREDDEWTYYFGRNITISAFDWTAHIEGGLKVSKSDQRVVPFSSTRNLPHTKLDSVPRFTLVRKVEESAPYFRQELIYNGRSGDSVKFLYRELAAGLQRLPFQQEVQYDLSSDSVIGFKGARLEVFEATNTSIRYKVERSFPDWKSETLAPSN
jgi:hypothetical protein